MDALKTALDCVIRAEALPEKSVKSRSGEKAAKLYAAARIKCYAAGLAFKLVDPEYDPELRDVFYEVPTRDEDEPELEPVEAEDSDDDESEEDSDESDDEGADEPEENDESEESDESDEPDTDSRPSVEESNGSETDGEHGEELSELTLELDDEVHALVMSIYEAPLSHSTIDQVCTQASIWCGEISEYWRDGNPSLADGHATRMLIDDVAERFQQEVSPLSMTIMDVLDLPFPMPFEQAQMDLERIKERLDERAFEMAGVDRRGHEKLRSDLAARIVAFDTFNKWSTVAAHTDQIGKEATAVQWALSQRKNVSSERRPETKFSKHLEWRDAHGFSRAFDLDEYVITLKHRIDGEGTSFEVSIRDKKLATPFEYSIVALRTTVSSFGAVAASASNIVILEKLGGMQLGQATTIVVPKQVLPLLTTHLISALHVDFEIKVLAMPLSSLMAKVTRGMEIKQNLKQERRQLKVALMLAVPPQNDDGYGGDAGVARVMRSQRGGSEPARFKPY